MHLSKFVSGSVAVLLLSTASVRADTPDVEQLKKEVASLRAAVRELQQQVAHLRGGTPSKAGIAARLSAAEALNSSSEQQAAFAVLAVEAAKVGDAKATKSALGRLNSSSAIQDATYKAALHLARAGLAEEAVELAKSLNSSSMSQKALAKIAKGELDD